MPDLNTIYMYILYISNVDVMHPITDTFGSRRDGRDEYRVCIFEATYMC